MFCNVSYHVKKIKQWLLEHAEAAVKALETRLKGFEDKLKGTPEGIVDDVKKIIGDRLAEIQKNVHDIAVKFIEYEKTHSPEAKAALIKQIDFELFADGVVFEGPVAGKHGAADVGEAERRRSDPGRDRDGQGP